MAKKKFRRRNRECINSILLCLTAQQETDLLIPLFLVLIIGIASIGIYLKRPASKTSSNESNQQKDLMKALPLKEQQILKIVMEEDGLTQKKIMHKTELPKATLSRNLKSLEQKNFISIAQDGYTNRVYITEWFKDKK
jgi:uncharacterized membrane protein